MSVHECGQYGRLLYHMSYNRVVHTVYIVDTITNLRYYGIAGTLSVSFGDQPIPEKSTVKVCSRFETWNQKFSFFYKKKKAVTVHTQMVHEKTNQ